MVSLYKYNCMKRRRNEKGKNILTPREREVLSLLIKGYSNSGISQELCISTHTAKVHVSSIYRKLEVDGRISATVKLSSSPISISEVPF